MNQKGKEGLLPLKAKVILYHNSPYIEDAATIEERILLKKSMKDKVRSAMEKEGIFVEGIDVIYREESEQTK